MRVLVKAKKTTGTQVLEILPMFMGGLRGGFRLPLKSPIISFDLTSYVP
jgi:hypothetical protein